MYANIPITETKHIFQNIMKHKLRVVYDYVIL